MAHRFQIIMENNCNYQETERSLLHATQVAGEPATVGVHCYLHLLDAVVASGWKSESPEVVHRSALYCKDGESN